jgi:transcriptional regulator with XRE-family HTH domain
MRLTTSEQIRLLCSRAGLSLSDLARATGQTPQNLNNKLKRDRFTVQELQAIAQAFGGSISVVWTDKDGKPIL